MFDIHVQPRHDLLFAGENLQQRLDKIERQWLTRLYYLAHSPFKLTWALDSNVLSCSPGAAQRFLTAALNSNLWGYHMYAPLLLLWKHLPPRHGSPDADLFQPTRVRPFDAPLRMRSADCSTLCSAHASQNLLSHIMYPHNFNIVYMWGPVTSDLLREWFLTALNEGVASDDQKSLHSEQLATAPHRIVRRAHL